MSTSSIHNSVHSVLGTALQETGLSSSSSSTSGSTSETQGDNGQLSPFAQLLSTLQQLHESNPTQYQQVTQQIATTLQNAAQTVTVDGNATAASQLNQLATDFTNASQSGQLPNINSLGNSRAEANVASSSPAPAFSGTPSAPTAEVHPSRPGLSPSSSASNTLAERSGSMLHHNSAPATGSTSDSNATASATSSSSAVSATSSSSTTATSESSTQTLSTGGGVNPYVSPAQQPVAAPDGYQYVPFGTGTSVVPTMSNWLSGWQQANSNLSPSAQQNQILNYGAGQGGPMFGANLPGTDIPWASLTQEQQAAYVEATGTGQSISDIQQFLSQYQGPNTPGNESYDEAVGS